MPKLLSSHKQYNDAKRERCYHATKILISPDTIPARLTASLSHCWYLLYHACASLTYSLTFTRKLMKLDEDNKQIMCSLTMRGETLKNLFSNRFIVSRILEDALQCAWNLKPLKDKNYIASIVYWIEYIMWSKCLRHRRGYRNIKVNDVWVKVVFFSTCAIECRNEMKAVNDALNFLLSSAISIFSLWISICISIDVINTLQTLLTLAMSQFQWNSFLNVEILALTNLGH